MSGAAGQGAPLILTALLPKDMHAWATALRTRHFPPERNHLEAHVTVFHAIPAHCEAEVAGVLKRLAAAFAPVDAELVGLMSLGRGTALKLESPGILRLREAIADHLHGLLTAQDQHRPRLHVTIQNRVSPAEAKALLASLASNIEPRRFAFRGFGLHRYMGGPWLHIGDFAFRGREKA
ncbi:2'-5' RNA ligase family protein [Erythrobacter sp. SDW2]|uniref:2'-5' RNA ligase family protein n=1 Tax=Erythrobacter sp. SDW2 TaxID=2907154 RepID=UPI001F1BE6CA|nr:2'-5' RNA ligase family protein [Erythrobacter sp. SDW2]UIP06080.1 2'-5' RNA ligase family protein [Erythrobacter sp. SDW2]